MFKIIKALRDIFFPPICLLCDKRALANSYFCLQCQDLKKNPPPLCQKCGRHLETPTKSGFCSECYRKKYFFDKVFAPFVYKKPLADILALFKYHRYSYLGEFLADKFINSLKKSGFHYKDYDFLTFVPMHHLKRREREYNQSCLLAESIAKGLSLKLQRVLRAKFYLPSQTTRKKAAREEEIKGNFEVKENLKEQKIILFDDVLTTGSTASECARALKEKGAKEVVVWALARGINENLA